MERPEDRLSVLNRRLALRVAVLGAVALGLFAVVFFRLWYLQVLSGDQYLAEANSNRVRELRIQAPRGEIVDRNGTVIVRNKQAVVVQIDPSKLPQAERDMAAAWGQAAGRRARRPKGERGDPVRIPPTATPKLRRRYQRLARVLDESASSIHRHVIRSLATVPYSAVRVKTDVSRSVFGYIAERPEQFPGVKMEEIYLRDYPSGELAAQIIGTVGEVSPKQLKQDRYRGVKQGTIVGQEGLERTYDRYLRGTDGIRRVQVDAFGRPFPHDLLRDRQPTGGQQVKLSLDFGLQRSGRRALEEIGGELPGAFVALDPVNGDVLAMGSYPSFDPNRLTRRITQERYDELYGEEAGAPRFNRAVSGSYPIGSTFKPVVALGMLQNDHIGLGYTIDDPGRIVVGGQSFQNAGAQPFGSVGLVRGLAVSSDVYYYRLGQRAHGLDDDPIQSFARKLGFGAPTGIDLPGEFGGTIPDEEWLDELQRVERECREEQGRRSCAVADPDAAWTVGQTMQLAIGQGGFQASPLQVAVAYATIANGGDVVTPHLGLEITDAAGVALQRIETDPARRIDFEDDSLRAVRQGLYGAAKLPGGTSAGIFDDWPDRFRVHGKTGTAELEGKADSSWYAGYVPDGERPIVVVANVEQGGFGEERAARLVCELMAEWYDVNSECSGGSGVSD